MLYNMHCFYRTEESGKSDAMCVCKKCREKRRSIKKESPEDVRLERAKEIARKIINKGA